MDEQGSAATGAITEEEALITAVAAGDDAAMRRLYDLFAPLVTAISVRMLPDRAAADELVEDVFVELWQRASQYDGSRSRLATWIATIARSRGIDRLRARQRRGRAGSAEDAARDTVAAAESDPVVGALASEQRVRVSKALRALAPEQREALELAYFAGLTQVQIAERLARPLGTVKSHMRLGLIRLRDELRIHEGHGP